MVDLNSLVVEDTNEWDDRNHQAEDNPACGWVQDSYVRKTAKKIVTTAGEARDVVRMLNRAAVLVDLGVRIRVVGKDGVEVVPGDKAWWEEVEKSPKGKLTVKFLAKDRTRRTRKPKYKDDTVLVEEFLEA
jgi:hypothetical protein